jgi:hypothetical protein
MGKARVTQPAIGTREALGQHEIGEGRSFGGQQLAEITARQLLTLRNVVESQIMPFDIPENVDLDRVQPGGADALGLRQPGRIIVAPENERRKVVHVSDDGL